MKTMRHMTLNVLKAGLAMLFMLICIDVSAQQKKKKNKRDREGDLENRKNKSSSLVDIVFRFCEI